MDTHHPRSGFTSQTSLSGHDAPATPPYTPAAKHKRRFDRSDSPASSIHPAETSSPARKVLKRTASDSIIVVELPDKDLDELIDAEVISPAELEEFEEVEDLLSDAQYHSDDCESDSGISSQFQKLGCDERQEESEMTKKRKERRLSKRTGSRVFKRLYSQSANSDMEVTDSDAANECDGHTSARRLRRRTHGPSEEPVGLDGVRHSTAADGASKLANDDNNKASSSEPVE